MSNYACTHFCTCTQRKELYDLLEARIVKGIRNYWRRTESCQLLTKSFGFKTGVLHGFTAVVINIRARFRWCGTRSD